MPNGMGIGTVLVSRNHLRSTSAGVESSLEPPRLISDQALNKSQKVVPSLTELFMDMAMKTPSASSVTCTDGQHGEGLEGGV